MSSFTETQKFRQWWIWLILISIVAFAFYSAYERVSRGEEDTYLYVQVTVALIGPLLIGVLFYFFKLDTSVDSTGIYYKFFPFHLKERTILWDDVASVEVRKYNPLKEYGGWGLRYSFKEGRAVNMRGNMGLQIVFKNGKKLLLGTQKREELQTALSDLRKPI